MHTVFLLPAPHFVIYKPGSPAAVTIKNSRNNITSAQAMLVYDYVWSKYSFLAIIVLCMDMYFHATGPLNDSSMFYKVGDKIDNILTPYSPSSIF